MMTSKKIIRKVCILMFNSAVFMVLCKTCVSRSLIEGSQEIFCCSKCLLRVAHIAKWQNLMKSLFFKQDLDIKTNVLWRNKHAFLKINVICVYVLSLRCWNIQLLLHYMHPLKIHELSLTRMFDDFFLLILYGHLMEKLF